LLQHLADVLGNLLADMGRPKRSWPAASVSAGQEEQSSGILVTAGSQKAGTPPERGS